MERNGNTGSFGIPDEMKQQMDKHKERRKEEEADQAKSDSEPTEAVEAKDDNNRVAEQAKTMAVLKELGVEFLENDFQSLIIKGFVEKNITIVQYKNIQLVATMKSLTADDYDDVEEILMREVNEVATTSNGGINKKAMLYLCYSITKLNGKPVNKTVFKDKAKTTVDTKRTALKRREVLRKMDGHVIDLMTRKQASYSLCMRQIINDPEQHLKNS